MKHVDLYEINMFIVIIVSLYTQESIVFTANPCGDLLCVIYKWNYGFYSLCLLYLRKQWTVWGQKAGSEC